LDRACATAATSTVRGAGRCDGAAIAAGSGSENACVVGELERRLTLVRSGVVLRERVLLFLGRAYHFLIVDEDLWDGELWDYCHAAFGLACLMAAETPRPVECVEEAHHYVTAYCFFDALKASPSS